MLSLDSSSSVRSFALFRSPRLLRETVYNVGKQNLPKSCRLSVFQSLLHILASKLFFVLVFLVSEGRNGHTQRKIEDKIVTVRGFV